MKSEIEVRVIFSRRKTISLALQRNGSFELRAPIGTSKKVIEAFLEDKKEWLVKHRNAYEEREVLISQLGVYSKEELRALAKQAREVITQKVRYYAPLVGVDYGRIAIRCQRSRWGSCSSKGNLNFNCLLMLLPDEVIDSVVVHELCHRKHMNHSAAFYKEVERVFPEYKRCDRWLKQNGSVYLERLPS